MRTTEGMDQRTVIPVMVWQPRVVPPSPSPRGPRLPDGLPERWDEEDDDGTE